MQPRSRSSSGRPLPPSLHPRGRRAAREAARRADGRAARPRGASTPVRVARVVAGLLSLLLLVGSGYGWMADRALQANITRISGLADAPDTDGQAQNILLIGDDHRPSDVSPAVLAQLHAGGDLGSVRTDTMMVLHIPADGSPATVVSFPRDSWVDIPGHGKDKLNAAFGIGSANGGGDAGGIRLLIQTIQQLAGLKIDHFVRVSLLGFYQIAQKLGPIKVCLNEPAKDSYSGINLPAGVSELDAAQALAFVRQRHGLPRGDLDREVRQQYFLSAALRTAVANGIATNPSRLRGLLGAIGSAMQTDPGLDLLRLASVFPHLSAADVRFTTIPTLGTPTITDDAGNRVSIVEVDKVALPAFFASINGANGDYTDAHAADPHGVKVRVVNGTDTAGLARSQTTALSRLGFSATTDPTSVSTSLTTVTYPPGQEAAAKAVAAAVPGALVAPSNSAGEVTLTLGSDGHRVSGPATGSGGGGGGGQTTSAPAGSGAPASTPTPAPGNGQSFSGTSCIN